jgi:hypothetical protein
MEAGLGKKAKPYFQITKEKRTGGMAKVVEHLPRKREALNSNPSILHVHIHSHTHTHTHTHIQTCIYTYIHIYIHIYTCIYILCRERVNDGT